MKGRVLAATLTALVMLGLALAGPGSAGGTRIVRFTSTVTIRITAQQGAAVFKGDVESPNLACRTNRTVRLMQRKPGKDLTVSVTPTHGQHWRIGLDTPTAGEYYARVVKRSEGTAGTIYVCRPDNSPSVNVAP